MKFIHILGTKEAPYPKNISTGRVRGVYVTDDTVMLESAGKEDFIFCSNSAGNIDIQTVYTRLNAALTNQSGNEILTATPTPDLVPHGDMIIRYMWGNEGEECPTTRELYNLRAAAQGYIRCIHEDEINIIEIAGDRKLLAEMQANKDLYYKQLKNEYYSSTGKKFYRYRTQDYIENEHDLTELKYSMLCDMRESYEAIIDRCNDIITSCKIGISATDQDVYQWYTGAAITSKAKAEAGLKCVYEEIQEYEDDKGNFVLSPECTGKKEVQV